MRLLILTPEFLTTGGGIATFYRNLVPALARAGIGVRVIEGSAFQAGPPNTVEIDGAVVEQLDHRRLRDRFDSFSSLAGAPTLRRHLAAAWAMWDQAISGDDFDVVEATDWGLLFLPPHLEQRRATIIQGHASIGQIATYDPQVGDDVQEAMVKLIEHVAMSNVTNFQTYSAANKSFWETECGVAAHVIRPAWRGPDAPERAPAVLTRGLVVGRIQKWKGPHILCEALALLGETSPEVDWIGRDVVWGEEARPASRYLSETYPSIWGQRIRAQAPIPPAMVAGRQAAALFNIVPSTWDVFNFTAVEAMASGRPTLVSRGAGASELITHGENGYIFEAGDALSLAAAISEVVRSRPERQAAIGSAAREVVRRELDPERIAAYRISQFKAAIQAFQASQPEPLAGWLRDVCAPKSSRQPMAFLNTFPLRDLGANVIARVSAKLTAMGR